MKSQLTYQLLNQWSYFDGILCVASGTKCITFDINLLKLLTYSSYFSQKNGLRRKRKAEKRSAFTFDLILNRVTLLCDIESITNLPQFFLNLPDNMFRNFHCISHANILTPLSSRKKGLKSVAEK